MTIFEAIAAQLSTLLTGLPGVTVARSREVPVSRGEGLFVIVRPEQANAENKGRSLGVTQWDAVFKITLIARAAVPDTTADAVLEAIHQRVMADPTLGNRCADLAPVSVSYDFEQADRTAVAIDLRYRARVLTQTPSLAAQA